jgi:alpha-L-fucosidase
MVARSWWIVTILLSLAGAALPAGERAEVPDYTAEVESLDRHESPAWFNNAKFGIFINWGIYSIPAWAPPGKEYAEWYWEALNRKGSPTQEYHLQTQGTEFSYDNFIPAFTASGFDPQAWMNLIRESGARYFVFDAKHHDGFSLYNTATTGRSSVAMGPRRDIVRELFDAARAYAPELKRGIYYSLYEWFHPAYSGKLPSNPYTGSAESYTGAWPIGDFVADHVLPQMRELIDGYDPDIFWCDGSWEKTAEYWRTGGEIAHYLNQAMRRDNPKDVVVNDRCRVTDPYGSPTAADFTTPEYSSYSSIVKKKWESSRGLDPFSYGYNRATAEADYLSTNEMIDLLVDITSKNGNLLLNIGPAADGSIPAIMQQRLREMGSWLAINGQAIFDTTYWRTSEEGNLRFTVKPNQAFYLIALDWPGERLTVASPVPIDDAQTITLLGYQGGPLTWWREADKLIISIPPDARSASEHAWSFKISQ